MLLNELKCTIYASNLCIYFEINTQYSTQFKVSCIYNTPVRSQTATNNVFFYLTKMHSVSRFNSNKSEPREYLHAVILPHTYFIILLNNSIRSCYKDTNAILMTFLTETNQSMTQLECIKYKKPIAQNRANKIKSV